MGWGKQKLRGRVEKKGERREQITEKQQEMRSPKEDKVRTLTGNGKEIKKEKIEKPKINILDQERNKEEEEIKEKIKESNRSMANTLRGRGRGDRRRRKERKRSNEHDKKHRSSRTRDNRNIY